VDPEEQAPHGSAPPPPKDEIEIQFHLRRDDTPAAAPASSEIEDEFQFH
jgi:hypothetical protein